MNNHWASWISPGRSGRFPCWVISPLWCDRISVRHRHAPPAARWVLPSSMVDDGRTHSLKVIAWTDHECKHHPEVQIYPLPSYFRKMAAGVNRVQWDHFSWLLSCRIFSLVRNLSQVMMQGRRLLALSLPPSPLFSFFGFTCLRF